LPEERNRIEDIRTYALHIKSEMWPENYELRIGYTMNFSTDDVNYRINKELEYYEKYKDSVFLLYEDDTKLAYKLFDTLNHGYICYDYTRYIGVEAYMFSTVEISYARKEADDRILYARVHFFDNTFMAGDSLAFVQLLKSLEVLKAGCDKKCLCYPN
jgi:hypothetical protein